MSVSHWPTRLAAALLLAVSVWMLTEAQRTLRSDWGSAAARHHVALWASGRGAPADAPQAWEQARDALQRALSITPANPVLHERLGDAYFAAGQRDWQREKISREHFAEAALHYGRAIELRPDEPATWAMLASARQAAGGDSVGVQAAWARALALGPFEGHVQPVLMQVVLTDWDGATPAMQNWAKTLFDRGSIATREQINAMAKPYGLVFRPDASSPPR